MTHDSDHGRACRAVVWCFPRPPRRTVCGPSAGGSTCLPRAPGALARSTRRSKGRRRGGGLNRTRPSKADRAPANGHAAARVRPGALTPSSIFTAYGKSAIVEENGGPGETQLRQPAAGWSRAAYEDPAPPEATAARGPTSYSQRWPTISEYHGRLNHARRHGLCAACLSEPGRARHEGGGCRSPSRLEPQTWKKGLEVT